jgi:hypothetical protein
MANSTRVRRKRKLRNHQAAKPHPDYPLTAHPSGRWCKKIKGRTYYFGSVTDPDAVLAKWLKEKDYLLAGRVPPDGKSDEPTLRDLGNAFLRHKQSSLNSSELSPRTFADCYRTCANLIDYFGRHRLVDDLRQDDFAGYRERLAKRLGPIALGNEIQKTRCVFKFALETRMLKTIRALCDYMPNMDPCSSSRIPLVPEFKKRAATQGCLCLDEMSTLPNA